MRVSLMVRLQRRRQMAVPILIWLTYLDTDAQLCARLDLLLCCGDGLVNSALHWGQL